MNRPRGEVIAAGEVQDAANSASDRKTQIKAPTSYYFILARRRFTNEKRHIGPNYVRARSAGYSTRRIMSGCTSQISTEQRCDSKTDKATC